MSESILPPASDLNPTAPGSITPPADSLTPGAGDPGGIVGPVDPGTPSDIPGAITPTEPEPPAKPEDYVREDMRDQPNGFAALDDDGRMSAGLPSIKSVLTISDMQVRLDAGSDPVGQMYRILSSETIWRNEGNGSATRIEFGVVSFATNLEKQLVSDFIVGQLALITGEGGRVEQFIGAAAPHSERPFTVSNALNFSHYTSFDKSLMAYKGERSGRPEFGSDEGDAYWDGSRWTIRRGGDTAWTSTEDVLHPMDVTTWEPDYYSFNPHGSGDLPEMVSNPLMDERNWVDIVPTFRLNFYQNAVNLLKSGATIDGVAVSTAATASTVVRAWSKPTKVRVAGADPVTSICLGDVTSSATTSNVRGRGKVVLPQSARNSSDFDVFLPTLQKVRQMTITVGSLTDPLGI